MDVEFTKHAFSDDNRQTKLSMLNSSHSVMFCTATSRRRNYKRNKMALVLASTPISHLLKVVYMGS